MLVGGYRLGAKVFITGRGQADLDKTVVEIVGDITAVQNAAAYRKGAQDEPNERAVTDHIARRVACRGRPNVWC